MTRGRPGAAGAFAVILLGALALAISVAALSPAASQANIKVWCDWCDEDDDPAGVVYDASEYEAALAAGQSASEARRDAAVAGAKVVLQRATRRGWMSPRDGAQRTGAGGSFRWLVPPGEYRVDVSKPGYRTALSRTVHVPPAVTDLHVALTRRPSDDGSAALLVPVGLGAGLFLMLRRARRSA
jgi:hypothetical protein